MVYVFVLLLMYVPEIKEVIFYDAEKSASLANFFFHKESTMFKCSHKALVILSGLVWFGVGLYLMPLGLNYLLAGTSGNRPALELLGPFLGGSINSALFLVALALIIGFLKGRHVLGKSARQAIERIKTFSNPTSLANLYSAKYYLLLAGMICLGMSMKWIGLPEDIRGFVDVAIGSALINGAVVYFRQAKHV